jgi:hypothetical protein
MERHTSVIRERITLTVGSLLCVVGMLWLSKLLHIPATPLAAGALLQQPSWLIALAMVWIVLIGGSALCSIFASAEHFEAGLFCAAIGISVLSGRLGPMRYALFSASGPSIYLTMALELVLIYLAVAIAWMLLHGGSRSGWLPAETSLGPDEPIDQKLLAMVMYIVVMIVLMLLLCRSDDKKQALASVAVASYLAALAAHQFVPAQPSAWFLIGPLIVGVIGYVGEFVSPTTWMIGDAQGYFSALAHPLPLDYASLAVAGTLLGYWTSRRLRLAAGGMGAGEISENKTAA